MGKLLTVKSAEIKPLIEVAWKNGTKKYYHFKNDSAIRYGRYVVMQAFLQEYYLRMDLATLQANIKQLQSWLNPTITKDGGQLQLGKALELISIMEQRAQIAFEPETVYRLASCIYFDDRENLSAYDKEYNEKKIASWKKDGVVDFFFHRLFQELTNLTVSSHADLTNYLTRVPELLKGWRTMEGILMR